MGGTEQQSSDTQGYSLASTLTCGSSHTEHVHCLQAHNDTRITRNGSKHSDRNNPERSAEVTQHKTMPWFAICWKSLLHATAGTVELRCLALHCCNFTLHTEETATAAAVPTAKGRANTPGGDSARMQRLGLVADVLQRAGAWF